MYRFGDIDVDPRAREVRSDGELVHLEPQAFDLLVHLIERRDEVVAKEALLDGVWGHGFVSESALTTRIKEVRRALGDDGVRQHTIRTVRGRGYRFVADLDDTSSAGELRPSNATALLGRAVELDLVSEWLATAPVVTLVGAGGVGKSALARAVVDRLCADGRDVHVIELTPLSPQDRLLPTVARALDVVFDPERIEHLIVGVAHLDALVVLDNCEHLADAVAEVVERLVTTPGCRIRLLATSQVRLGVTGERVLSLEPLASAAAVDLFVDRAAAIRPGWSPGHGDQGRLRQLVEHLDRLPLMIEMAAARLGSMTLDDLEQAVRDGSRLSGLSHRSATPRHRTLGSLVEWSADLLSETSRRGFVEMAAFAGAVTASDAAAVIGSGAQSILAELTERSLVVADLSGSSARYRMLETVRMVATRWLADSGHASAARRRHAHWVAATLETIDVALRGPEETWGCRRLEGIVDEVRHAHRWARRHDVALADGLCELLFVAAYNRVWAEPTLWAGELLESATGTALGPQLPGARLLVAGAAANSGDLETARCEAGRVLADRPSTRLEALAREVLSDVALYGGRLDEVEEHAAALQALGEELHDPHVSAHATVNRSLGSIFRGDPLRGLAMVDGLDTSHLSPSSQAWVAYTTGEAHAQQDAVADAVAALHRAIALGDAVANPFVTSVSRSALAAQLARAGSHREAYAAYDSGLRTALRHGNVVHAVTMVGNLAALLHADGDDRSAVVIATATWDEARRPEYGDHTAGLSTLLERIEATNPPDVYAAWVAEGVSLPLEAAVAFARNLAASRAGA